MNIRISLLSIIVASISLSACSSIANKSPDEMVRYAMQHNLTRDNQYTFEGNITFAQENKIATDEHSNMPIIDTGDEAAKVTHDESAVDMSTDADGGGHDHDHTHQHEADKSDGIEQFLDQQHEPSAYSTWMQHWFKSVSLPYSGAVDIPKGKFEIIPEFRYQNRNALLSISFPMQADFKNMSLLVDPAAISPFIDMAGLKNDIKPLGDQYVRISLPEHLRQQIPLDTLARALPKAMDDSYAAIDKQAFSRLPMDEIGHQASAHYRIGLDIDLKQNQQMVAAVIQSLVDQLNAEADTHPEGSDKQTQIQRISGTLEILAMMYNKPMALSQDNEFNSEYNEAIDELNHIMADMRTHTDYYLDRRGRLVALRQQMALPKVISQTLGGSDAVTTNAVYWMQLHYTKNPNFILKSTPANTIELTELIPSLGEKMNQILGEPMSTTSDKDAKADEETHHTHTADTDEEAHSH